MTDHIREVREVPEERSVIGNRSDLAWIGRGDDAGARVGRVDHPRHDARAFRFTRCPRGAAERHVGDCPLVARDFLERKWRALQQHRGEVTGLVRDEGRHDHVRLRFLDTEFLERAPCGHHVPRRPVRRVLEVELAELHDHDAAVGEVLETLFDHLARVEVTLGQHECTRRRGVVRGVAVRRDEPHEVVAVAAASQKRPAVALVDIHARLVRKVAGELPIPVPDEVYGDRIQFDPLDVFRAVVERRHDLVATRRADDQCPIGRGAEDAERQGPRVVVEAGDAFRVAVEPRNDRTEGAVVEQRLELGPDLGDVDPKHRAPIGGGRVLGARLRGLRQNIGHGDPNCPQPKQRDHPACDELRHRAVRHRDEPDRGKDQGREHEHLRRPQPHDERDRGHASKPGPHQIREVQTANAVAPASEQRRHDDAERDERREEGETHESEDGEVLERRLRAVVPDPNRVDRDPGH